MIPKGGNFNLPNKALNPSTKLYDKAPALPYSFRDFRDLGPIMTSIEKWLRRTIKKLSQSTWTKDRE